MRPKTSLHEQQKAIERLIVSARLSFPETMAIMLARYLKLEMLRYHDKFSIGWDVFSLRDMIEDYDTNGWN